VSVAGAELARGITAAPAVSRNNTILIRSDALRRWLWTRTETALRGPRDNAFALALRAYGADTDVEAAVTAMADGGPGRWRTMGGDAQRASAGGEDGEAQGPARENPFAVLHGLRRRDGGREGG